MAFMVTAVSAGTTLDVPLSSAFLTIKAGNALRRIGRSVVK